MAVYEWTCSRVHTNASLSLSLSLSFGCIVSKPSGDSFNIKIKGEHLDCTQDAISNDEWWKFCGKYCASEFPAV